MSTTGKHTAGPASVRWNGRTDDLPDNERYCTCCGRELSAAHRMLELDQRSDTHHDFRDVPEAQSQGWFPFGLTCAQKLVDAEKTRPAALSKAKEGEA
jgi:hypothetical protein